MPIDFTRTFCWRNRGKLDVPNDEAWQPSRLLPLLAGLVELEPWLHQWYAEPDDSGESPADYYTSFIDTELAALAYGRADLTAEKLPS
jgi:hypothetical protein